MTIKSTLETKKETLEELEKIRSLSYSIIGQNNILAYFAFNILLISPKISRARLASILGEDIPKQVVSKARKVVKYIKESKPYIYNDKEIYLKASDFQSTDNTQPVRSVLKTYGHIERYEAQIKKDLDDLHIRMLKDFNNST